MMEADVKKIRFHDLRHTFASHYVMNGGNIFELQQILGRSDTKTTMRYSHFSPDHIAHTANIVRFSYTIEELDNVINLENGGN